jgi:hypothetical protein
VRPSTWAFTTAVDDDALHRVLDVARFAPSGGNRQGWRLVVVRHPDARRRLRELYVPHWDAYPLVQNALLGLRAEVLGAAFATLPTPAEDDVRALLRIPAGSPWPGTSASVPAATPGPSSCRAGRSPSSRSRSPKAYCEPWPATP